MPNINLPVDYTVDRMTVSTINCKVMLHVLTFDPVAKRLTIDVPDDLHEAFLRQCFNAKPRTTMKHRIIEFMAKETGKPMPKMVDRRKLTMKEREKLK